MYTIKCKKILNWWTDSLCPPFPSQTFQGLNGLMRFCVWQICITPYRQPHCFFGDGACRVRFCSCVRHYCQDGMHNHTYWASVTLSLGKVQPWHLGSSYWHGTRGWSSLPSSAKWSHHCLIPQIRAEALPTQLCHSSLLSICGFNILVSSRWNVTVQGGWINTYVKTS